MTEEIRRCLLEDKNLRKLARQIMASGHTFEILTVLATVLPARQAAPMLDALASKTM